MPLPAAVPVGRPHIGAAASTGATATATARATTMATEMAAKPEIAETDAETHPLLPGTGHEALLLRCSYA